MATTETANVGRAVAARVGSNIREVRTKLSLTQAQLASPEFSISYISAIERGKIRPSHAEAGRADAAPDPEPPQARGIGIRAVPWQRDNVSRGRSN